MNDNKPFERIAGENWDQICLHMLKKSILSDVNFLFNEEDKVVMIKAHKLFLAIRSPVFHGMFYGPLATYNTTTTTSTSNGQESIDILIEDIKSDVFTILLKYLYCFKALKEKNDCFKLLTPQFLVDTLYAAKKYMLEDIQDAIVKHINSSIDMPNAYFYFGQSIKFHEEIDRGLCCKILAKNGPQFLKTVSFFDLSSEELLSFLLNDKTALPEVDLVNGTFEWAKYNYAKRGEKLDPSQMREALGEDIIKAIRYPLLKANDFYELFAKTGILNHDEIDEVYLKLLKVPHDLEFASYSPSTEYLIRSKARLA